MKRLQVIVLSLAFYNCSKSEDLSIPYPENLVVWSANIVPNPEFQATISMHPALYEGDVLFGTSYNMHNETAPILFFDNETGHLNKAYGDPCLQEAFYNKESVVYTDNQIYFRQREKLFNFDLLSLSFLSSIELPLSVPYLYIHNQEVYTGYLSESLESDAVLKVVDSDLSIDTIYSFVKDGIRRPNFDSFGFGLLPNGDQVMVWKSRSSVYGNHHYNRTEIFAYNLSADSLMWRNTDMDISGGVIPLKISDNRVIATVQDHVFVLELTSGKLMWEVNVSKSINAMFGLGFYQGDVHIEGDKIYAMSTSGAMVILDKHTGRILKVIRDIGLGFSDRFTYFEGKLFFSTGTLNILDLASDEIVFQSHESMGFDDIQSRIVIDEETRLMYFHNGREAFCVKMPAGI